MRHRTTPARRNVRVTLQLTDIQRSRFQAAAELRGQTLREFVVWAGENAAAQLLEGGGVVALSAADSAALVEVLLNPSPPNAKLRAAAARYEGLSVSRWPTRQVSRRDSNVIDGVRGASQLPSISAFAAGHARTALPCWSQGWGHGRLLLLDAYSRSLQAARAVASAAIVVDAKAGAAVAFHARHGFLPLPEQPRRLFLPMRAVEALGGITL